MMRAAALIITLCCAVPSRGQLLDSIGMFAAERARIVVKLDMRGSFINNRNVQVAGVKLGLEHAGRFQYGLGYNFLLRPVTRDVNVEGFGPATVELRMAYVSPYVDYAFYQRGPWEVRLPVQLGFGGARTVFRDGDGRLRPLQRSGVVVYEPAMTVQYRFWRYVAVGGGWGFRLVWQTGGDLGENLNAPIYSLGLRVFFGEVWRELIDTTE